MGPEHIGVTTFTFLGHVTSSVTWPFDSPDAISYRCPIVTESLSPNIFAIMGSLYIWVTTLTFRGHVTSSITWPIDPPRHFLLVSHCNRTSISDRFWHIRPPKPVCTHRHTPKVILYSVPCDVLHWTDKNSLTFSKALPQTPFSTPSFQFSHLQCLDPVDTFSDV